MSAEKRPVKGILKSSTSFDKGGEPVDMKNDKREMKWDEMSILATYHPEGKDYGHMKIDEPPTPYSALLESDDNMDSLDPTTLASKLEKGSPRLSGGELDSTEEEDENLTEEEIAKRKKFELKRKLHYNEYHAVKLGKQLLDEEENEDDDEDSSSTATTSQLGQ